MPLVRPCDHHSLQRKRMNCQSHHGGHGRAEVQAEHEPVDARQEGDAGARRHPVPIQVAGVRVPVGRRHRRDHRDHVQLLLKLILADRTAENTVTHVWLLLKLILSDRTAENMVTHAQLLLKLILADRTAGG